MNIEKPDPSEPRWIGGEHRTTRAQHIEWCKERALDYCDKGELQMAFSSMSSDLQKHTETAGHIGTALGMKLLVSKQLDTIEKMKRYINGFK